MNGSKFISLYLGWRVVHLIVSQILLVYSWYELYLRTTGYSYKRPLLYVSPKVR